MKLPPHTFNYLSDGGTTAYLSDAALLHDCNKHEHSISSTCDIHEVANFRVSEYSVKCYTISFSFNNMTVCKSMHTIPGKPSRFEISSFVFVCSLRFSFLLPLKFSQKIFPFIRARKLKRSFYR